MSEDRTPGDPDEARADGPALIVLSSEALAEIAAAFAGVDMASMPQVPLDAPCRQPDANPEDWFEPLRSPEWLGFQPSHLEEIAAWLCDGCPVLAECLKWALDNPQQGGILGGVTERGRELLREERGDPALTARH